MRIAAGREWRPATGTVVDWTPTDATVDAGRAAHPHPVGPSFLQRDHIVAVRADRLAGREHHAFTCATVPVPEVLDLDRMTAALNGFLRDHDGWRSTFRFDGDDVKRGLVDASDIEVAPHLLPQGTDPIDHLHRRLPATAVFDVFPAVAFGAVAHDDSFDFYFAIDHAFGDASSQAIGLAEILSRYHGDDGPRPVVGASHIEHTASEYARAAGMTTETESVQRWESILGGATPAIPPFPLDLGIVDGRAEPVRIDQVRIADADLAERLSGWAKASGSGLSALVFAALGVTERRLVGRERYLTATVLSTRHGDHVAAQGWYINFVPVAFDVRTDDLADVLPDAARGLAVAKEMSADPVHGALGVLIGKGGLDPSVITNPQMVSYLDFRWFPAADRLREALIFTGEGVTDHASIWISRTDDGLFAATQRPDNPIAEASVAKYFDTLGDVLASVDQR
ncbi:MULTISPECIES: condensation domain-containing protein [Gordonia]|uniref:condensation domain-containing protein n=1 Tax=Gordonia TaxID=2053 RepID=UPI0030FE7697